MEDLNLVPDNFKLKAKLSDHHIGHNGQTVNVTAYIDITIIFSNFNNLIISIIPTTTECVALV